MKSCWHADPSIRPTFLEIVTRLAALAGLDASSLGNSSSSAGSSSQYRLRSHSSQSKLPKSVGGSSGSRNSSVGSAGYTSAHLSRMLGPTAATGGPPRILPPSGENIAIVFSDITSTASLWEHDAEAMRDATLLHNQILRSLITKYRGYEVRSSANTARHHHTTGEGSFCIVFQDLVDALHWCGEAQTALLEATWPESLLKHPGAQEEWGVSGESGEDWLLF